MNRTLKKILTAVLCVCMFFTLTAGLVTLIAHRIVDSGTALGVRVIDSEYYEKVYDAVYASLEREMALVVIQPEDISDIITEDLIRENAPVAASALLRHIFDGAERDWEFESDALYERIDSYLSEYSAEAGIEYAEGSADQVYGMICDTVTAELKIVPDAVSHKAGAIVAKVRYVCGFWWLPMLLYVCFAAAVIYLGKRHMKNAAYNVVLPSYLASFTVFAAAAVLYSKDYFATTVLDDGILQHMIRQLYLTALGDVRNTAGAIAALLLIMGIVLSFAIALKGKRKRRK